MLSRRKKLVIRKIPPNVTETDFKQALSSYTQVLQLASFRQGHVESLPSLSRDGVAYIRFRRAQDIFDFSVQFPQQHTFQDEKGNPIKVEVEYAPFQRPPRGRGGRDHLENTIENDPDYQAFAVSLTEEVKALPSAEQQLEEKEALAKANAAAGIKPPERIAPIIQYIKAAQTKSAAKAAAAKPKALLKAEEAKKTRELQRKSRDKDHKGGKGGAGGASGAAATNAAASRKKGSGKRRSDDGTPSESNPHDSSSAHGGGKDRSKKAYAPAAASHGPPPSHPSPLSRSEVKDGSVTPTAASGVSDAAPAGAKGGRGPRAPKDKSTKERKERGPRKRMTDAASASAPVIIATTPVSLMKRAEPTVTASAPAAASGDANGFSSVLSPHAREFRPVELPPALPQLSAAQQAPSRAVSALLSSANASLNQPDSGGGGVNPSSAGGDGSGAAGKGGRRGIKGSGVTWNVRKKRPASGGAGAAATPAPSGPS